MKELQFIRGMGQGNIYSTSTFGKVTLTASGNYGRVLAHANSTTLLELSLSSIPHGSDIIAIDTCQDEHHIIAVTFIQATQIGIEDIKTPYMNFYSVWTPENVNEPTPSVSSSSRTSDSSLSSKSSSSSSMRIRNLSSDNIHLRPLESIGQKCVQFKLNFIPYHLSHFRVQNDTGAYETLFLLTGSDCRIHIYKPTPETESFTQVPTQTHFPELYGIFPSVVTRLRIIDLPDPNKRLTLCGCEDGFLRSFIISKSEIIRAITQLPMFYFKKKSSAESDRVFDETEEDKKASDDDETVEKRVNSRNSLESVSYFNDHMDLGPFVERVTLHFDGMITSIEPFWKNSILHVVVASSSSPVYVFTDPVVESFRKGLSLKFSSRWDAVNALCVADIDSDGDFEIVIGTFGCTLIVYKFMEEIGQWVIVGFHKVPSAIFAVVFADSNLSVITGSGLHIIEYYTKKEEAEVGPTPA